MKLSEAEATDLLFDSSMPGYCTECDGFTTEGVEPDATERECPQCGAPTVMGAETAVVTEHIKVDDVQEAYENESH